MFRYATYIGDSKALLSILCTPAFASHSLLVRLPVNSFADEPFRPRHGFIYNGMNGGWEVRKCRTGGYFVGEISAFFVVWFDFA